MSVSSGTGFYLLWGAFATQVLSVVPYMIRSVFLDLQVTGPDPFPQLLQLAWMIDDDFQRRFMDLYDIS